MLGMFFIFIRVIVALFTLTGMNMSLEKNDQIGVIYWGILLLAICSL